MCFLSPTSCTLSCSKPPDHLYCSLQAPRGHRRKIPQQHCSSFPTEHWNHNFLPTAFQSTPVSFARFPVLPSGAGFFSWIFGWKWKLLPPISLLTTCMKQLIIVLFVICLKVYVPLHILFSKLSTSSYPQENTGNIFQLPCGSCSAPSLTKWRGQCTFLPGPTQPQVANLRDLSCKWICLVWNVFSHY